MTFNSNNKKFNRSTLSLFISSILTSSMAVQAQEPITTKVSDEHQGIEIIVVTAQKRQENINEVPISIATFTQDNIEKTGVRQLTEIAEFIPNLQISNSNDFSSQITIRGVGAPNRNIGFDARVGVYLDGVYLGQSPALNQELLDLERVEVLRGPQGTLYGKNNVAGAINLISSKPSDEFSVHTGLEFGNYDSQQYTLSVNTPLSDRVLAKFSVNQQLRDGFVENTETGNMINEQDALSYRGQFSFLVSDNFTAHFSFDGLRSERLSFDGVPITDALGNNPLAKPIKNDQVSFNSDPYEDRDVTGENLTLEYTFANDYTFKSITGHRDTRINYINDFDYSTDEIAELDYLDDYQQWSQELQLISAPGDFQYIAGLYLYHQDAHTARISNVADGTLDAFTGVPREAIEAAAEAGDPSAIFLLAAFHPGQLSTIGDVDTKSYALFFNSDYQLNDKLKLAVGARYSKEDKEVDWTASSIDPTTGSSVIPIFELANGRVQDKRSDTDLSPTITLSYQVSDNINSYVKYATGYKSGGYNVDFLTQDQLDAGLEFDKETVQSYEIGVKGLILEQRLSFSAVTFFSQYDDYQIQQLIDLGAGTTALSIRNAAEVETKGAEFEMTYMATDNLQLTASLALLDGEFAKFPGGGNTGEDLSGYSLPGVSDYSYHVSAQYYYPVAQFQADLVMRVSYNYLDDYNTSVDGESEIAMADGSMLAVGDVEGYGILNGRIGLSASDEAWSAYLWGRNILDEDAETAVGVKGFFGTRLNQYVSPRTYGVSVNYNF